MPTTPKGDKAAAAFARRLRSAMEARGLVSESSRSGLDVAALAGAAGTSYEMARRYAEGRAMPKPDTIQRIAGWLKVPAAVLAYGSTGGDPSGLNSEVLEKCIEAVMQAQAQTGITLSPDRSAKLATMLYLEAVEGRPPAAPTVVRMLRAMS